MSRIDIKDKNFIQLQKEWYKRLKDSGFNDLESFDTEGQPNDLLKTDVRIDTKKSVNIYQAKQDYYRFAGQFLYDYNWQNALERLIWELHSEGFSSREIQKELLPAKTNKTTINNILNRIKKDFRAYIKTSLPASNTKKPS